MLKAEMHLAEAIRLIKDVRNSLEGDDADLSLALGDAMEQIEKAGEEIGNPKKNPQTFASDDFFSRKW